MTRHRIFPASQLKPGLATIIVTLPGRTIRSRAVMVQHHGHGTVQVAFECGEILYLSSRSMIGCIETEKTSRRAPAGQKVAAVLVFAIELKSIVRNNVMQPNQHPFGEATCVCTLVDQCVRKALATCEVVPDDDPHMDTLTFYCDFCDAAAERIHDGEELQYVLETTWRLSSATSPAPRTPPVVEDAGDVVLDDEDSAAVA